MKDWQFLIICGLLVSISRHSVDGIEGNIMGMLSGLLIGFGAFLWITNRSDKPKE